MVYQEASSQTNKANAKVYRLNGLEQNDMEEMREAKTELNSVTAKLQETQHFPQQQQAAPPSPLSCCAEDKPLTFDSARLNARRKERYIILTLMSIPVTSAIFFQVEIAAHLLVRNCRPWISSSSLQSGESGYQVICNNLNIDLETCACSEN